MLASVQWPPYLQCVDDLHLRKAISRFKDGVVVGLKPPMREPEHWVLKYFRYLTKKTGVSRKHIVAFIERCIEDPKPEQQHIISCLKERHQEEVAVKKAYLKAKAEKEKLAAAALAAGKQSADAMEEDEEINLLESEEDCLLDEEGIQLERLSQQASQSQDGAVVERDRGTSAGAEDSGAVDRGDGNGAEITFFAE